MAPNKKDESLYALIERGQAGDKEAMETLLSMYEDVIKKVVRNFFVNGAEEEDLYQEGRIAFCDAVRDYRRESKASLSTFANLCIRRRIYSCIRKSNTNRNKTLSLAMRQSLSEGNEKREIAFRCGMESPDPEEVYIVKEEGRAYLDYLNNQASSLARNIIRMRVNGYTYKEISQVLDVNTKRIDNAIQSVRKMKKQQNPAEKNQEH